MEENKSFSEPGLSADKGLMLILGSEMEPETE